MTGRFPEIPAGRALPGNVRTQTSGDEREAP